MAEPLEQKLRDALAFADSIIDTMREPLLVLDAGLRVVRASREFCRTFVVTPEETEGRLVYDLGDRQWDIPRLRALLEEILPQDATFRDYEVEHTFERISRKVMLLNARKLHRELNGGDHVLLVIEDVTERRDAERARRDAEVRFTEMVRNVRDHSIFLIDPDGVVTSWNVAAERIIGHTEAEAVGQHFSLIFTPEDVAAGLPEQELRQAREWGRAEDERWHRRKSGETFWALGIVTPLRDVDGRITGYSKILRDPLYKGFVRFDGIIAKGRHEPIVEECVWERVQEVLAGRCKNTPKPKDLTLRELFFFGNLLMCPRCGRTLCPYRVKRRYVYYECKNPETSCKVLVPQPVLVDQLPSLLRGVKLEHVDLEGLRADLLKQHRQRSGEELGQRSTLNAEYEQVVKQIGDVFSQRKEEEALGVLKEIDTKLTELRRRRDDLQGKLNVSHDKGNAWIETVMRCFELIELLQEAIIFGSARPREMVLRGLASNYSVEGKKLVWKPRAPFRQVEQKGDRPDWCTELYDVRTEIEETCRLLETAYWVGKTGRASRAGLTGYLRTKR